MMPNDQRRYHLIVNPTAGHGRTARLWPRLLQRLGQEAVDVEWSVTSSPHEATAIAEQVDEDQIAVAVGGDGTLNEIVRGLPDGRTITIIPTGIRNDFARAIGVSLHPPTALKQMISGDFRWIDLPEVNGHPFVRMATVEPIFPRRSRRSNVFSAYTELFSSLSQMTRKHISVDLDGHRSTGDALFVAIGNCQFSGGGFNLCPKARFDDGLLDIVIANALSKVQLIPTIAHLRTGRHIRSRHFHHAKGHRLIIDGPKDVAVFADDRWVGRLPATFTLRQRAFQVVVPRGTWVPSKVVSIRRRFVEENTTIGEQ